MPHRAILRIYDDLSPHEVAALEEMRRWAIAQGAANEHLIGGLGIVQRVIDGGTLGHNDTWKMNALGVLFGDTLQHAMGDRLSWVVAEDNTGRAYALRWQRTDLLVYPLSAIKSRMLAAETIQVQLLFDEYVSAFTAHSA